MGKKENDKLIQDFMLQHKKEVTDNLFTESVMRKLPAQQRNNEWIIVLLAAIGTILTLVLIWGTEMTVISMPLLSDINLYYLLGGVFVSPFVLWLCFELSKTKSMRLF